MKKLILAGLAAAGLFSAIPAEAAIVGGASAPLAAGVHAPAEAAAYYRYRRGPHCRVVVTRHRTPRGVVVRRVRRCW